MTPREATCLVIEDDADIGDLLHMILTQCGFTVHLEATGAEGLAAAAGLRPDLITVDLGLPDVHGHEVIRKLRETTNVPILVITAYAQTGDELDSVVAGASAHLIKPFRPAQLRELVQELCPQPGQGHRRAPSPAAKVS